MVRGSNASTTIVASTTTYTSRRWFGSGGGARGARGHGWWQNYRAGKGGRHLQGTYSHLDLDEMKDWNEAVFGLGKTLAYMDVKLEAIAQGDDNSNGNDDHPTTKSSSQIQRLTLELATEALPLATENFLKLLVGGATTGGDDDSLDLGYHSTTLHRIEKGVGILGGLVARNPNHQSLNPKAPLTQQKMGRCHPDLAATSNPTSMDISSEKLVLHHLEGVLTMLQPRVGEIDSRFLLLSHGAPHLDGVSLAVGRLADEASLRALQEWESTLITSHGVPTNAVLKIVKCGLVHDGDGSKHKDKDETATAA